MRMCGRNKFISSSYKGESFQFGSDQPRVFCAQRKASAHLELENSSAVSIEEDISNDASSSKFSVDLF